MRPTSFARPVHTIGPHSSPPPGNWKAGAKLAFDRNSYARRDAGDRKRPVPDTQEKKMSRKARARDAQVIYCTMYDPLGARPFCVLESDRADASAKNYAIPTTLVWRLVQMIGRNN